MELSVIRHKTARDFFVGFYPEEQVGSYSYQLERMFEQGSAKTGDYYVVTDKEKPLLSLEIYRNNTRRILEKLPLTALNRKINSKEFTQAMDLIFDYLNDEIISGSIDKELQINIPEDYRYFKEYENLLKKYKFINILTVARFELNLKNLEVVVSSGSSYKKLIDMPVEERFGLISKSTFIELLDRYSNEKVYIDLLEEGYQSEEIWYIVEYQGKEIGYMMLSFTDGLKYKMELLNYGSFDDKMNDILFSAIIERSVQIAQENEIEEIAYNINFSDSKFIDLMNKSGCKDFSIIKNYIRF